MDLLLAKDGSQPLFHVELCNDIRRHVSILLSR